MDAPSDGGPRAKTLILLRHAKSSWDFDLDDHERPLAPRGRAAGLWVGECLVGRGLVPDRVLCSSAVRTIQTWERAELGGATARDVRIEAQVYAASPGRLQSLIHDVPEEVGTLMLIGHAPGIPDLAAQLSGLGFEVYPTAGLTILDVTEPWSQLSSARVREFLTPRD